MQNAMMGMFRPLAQSLGLILAVALSASDSSKKSFR